MKWAVRQGMPSDFTFIVKTMSSGYYYGNDYLQAIPQDEFMIRFRKFIEQKLPQVEVRVACLPDDPDVILGYCLFNGPVLHWIYTKKPWRKFGIARSLLPQGVTHVTHLSKLGEKLKPKEWVYNPFIVGEMK